MAKDGSKQKTRNFVLIVCDLLIDFHNSGNCRQPSCTAEGCGKKHHRLLHQETQTVLVKERHQPQTEFSGFVKANQNVTQTLLQTAVAKMIVDQDQEIPVRVLLDPGSQRSYIRKQIAESVGLRGPTELLSVSTLGGETSQTRRMHIVKFSLLGSQVEDESAPIEMEALTIDKVCVNLDPVKVDVSKYDHLRGIKFADTYPRGSAEIDILVGADHYHSIVDGRCIKGNAAHSPTAVGSCLGWILCGPIEKHTGTRTTTMLSTVSLDEVTSSLKQFWELESIGIIDDQHAKWSLDEESAFSQFKKSLKFDGERYEVALPWKENHPKLRDNYKQAVKRLVSTENQLKRNDERAAAYSEAINQYIQDGYAKEVISDSSEVEKRVRYLPHHAVFREDKSSTKAHDTDEASLNDCVLPGPALQPNLVSVLLRFRSHPIAIMADVKKMSLQIKLASEDQDVHHYLWRDMKTDIHLQNTK